jgi:hypothetical protein
MSRYCRLKVPNPNDQPITVRIYYRTSDGREFDCQYEAAIHQAGIPSAFEIDMNNRSLFRKLFNLPPKIKYARK